MESEWPNDNLSVDENSSTFIALRNELILEKVCRFLTLKEVKNCRLTSPHWNQEFVNLMRRRCGYVNPSDKKSEALSQYLKFQFPDHLQEDSEAQLFINTLCEDGLQIYMIQSLVQLTNLIENSSEFPCTKFKLGANIINKPSDDLALENFLKVVSSFITELWLEKKSGKNSCFQCNPTATLQFCTLKVLSISLDGFEEDTGLAQDIRFFAMIIENSPNLDTISLESRGSVRFFTDFLNEVNPHVLKRIENLSICGKLESSHFTRLADMKLELSVLSLNILLLFKRPHPSPESILHFLTSQARNLKELRIEALLTENITIILPDMKNLKLLEIGSFSTGPYKIKFPGINLDKQFPALQQVTLSGQQPNLVDIFGSDNWHVYSNWADRNIIMTKNLLVEIPKFFKLQT